MQYLIVAIQDNKAEAITNQNYLMLHRHIATATRMFTDLAQDAQSGLHKHLEDYDLVCLGTLDDTTLQIIPELTTILTGSQLKTLLANA